MFEDAQASSRRLREAAQRAIDEAEGLRKHTEELREKARRLSGEVEAEEKAKENKKAAIAERLRLVQGAVNSARRTIVP